MLFYNHINSQSTTNLTPAEMLQNHRLRSQLDLIKPDLQTLMEKKQYGQQTFANLHSYDRQFNTEEAVYIKNFAGERKWIAAKLYRPVGNVSYEVVLEDRWHVKLHLNHIRKRSDSPEHQIPIILYGAIYTI